MRDLKRIEESNRPGAKIAGSRNQLIIDEVGYGESPVTTTRNVIEFHAPEHGFELEVPPMFKYVKETFNVPATWWDHLKITIRGHAAVHYGDWGYRVVCQLFRNIKSTRIPVVYEIHAKPKIIPRVKGRAK